MGKLIKCVRDSCHNNQTDFFLFYFVNYLNTSSRNGSWWMKFVAKEECRLSQNASVVMRKKLLIIFFSRVPLLVQSGIGFIIFLELDTGFSKSHVMPLCIGCRKLGAKVTYVF